MHTYYNTNILKLLPPAYQKIFREAALKNKKNVKANSALIRLVNNLYTGALPTPDYVSGPFTLSYHFSEYHRKSIYVFGELHGTENECSEFPQSRKNSMEMPEFLERTFENTPVFIDFYMEMFPHLGEHPYEKIERATTVDPTYLNRIRAKVFNCTFQRKECGWRETMRAHWTDPRYADEHFANIATSREPKISLSKRETDELKKIQFLKRKPREFADFIMEELKKNKFVSKEMKKSTLSFNEFREIIVSFLERFPVREDREISKKMKRSNVVVILLNLHALVLDAYQLSRIFKRFSSGPNSKQPEEPHYIISYAGDAHSFFLRVALDYLNFSKKEAVKFKDIKNLRCTKVKGFVPLFKDVF